MKILMSAHCFPPSVGGLERVSATLAQELAALGHEVRVLTQTPAKDEPPADYAVHRRPTLRQTLALLRWADVYLQSNISLRTLWPALLLRKPTLVVYHGRLSRPDDRIAWQDRLKRTAARFVRRNLAVSTHLARTVPGGCGVIPNPYDDQLFTRGPGLARSGDLLFLGRLVSEKGADGLIDALVRLRSRGLQPTLTIVGSGPEEPALKAQCERAGLQNQVRFAGTRSGQALVEELRSHRLLVVPSLCAEAFGMVTLEGLACGMQVIVADAGGLPEALGPCGYVFPRGDWEALALRIESALTAPPPSATMQAVVNAHLGRYKARAVALQYQRHLEQVALPASLADMEHADV